MRSVADIIELWPSAEHFAGDIGLKYPSYGRVIKMRGRLPTKYWDATLAAAATRGFSLTRADLETANAAPSHSTPEMARAS